MLTTLKFTQIGNSVGVVRPKESLAGDGACVMKMLSVAASLVDEATFAAWLRVNNGVAPR